jgi:dihydroorotate dehydrogenase
VLYEQLVRPALLRVGRGDAERAHRSTLARLARLSEHPAVLAGLRRLFAVSAPVCAFGLDFANPVGLAAGLDKDGQAVPAWAALGFGFVEVGTVTPQAQLGNPAPRLFRLPASAALINRMGFNNQGAPALAQRLPAAGKSPVPVGVSLGKGQHTPVGAAVQDYLRALRAVHDVADYLAVNVSSPNTAGLRTLQDRGQLVELLAALRAETAALATAGTGGPSPRRTVPPVGPCDPVPAAGPGGRTAAAGPGALSAAGAGARTATGPAPRTPKPILVKIAPDLTDAAVAEVISVCLDHGVAGLIATNTSTGRAGLHPRDGHLRGEPGGLSGAPLAPLTLRTVAFVHHETAGRLPVVGVGGIMSPDDALALLDAGATLLQLYTGLIYHGPGLVRRINSAVCGRRQKGHA